MKLYIFLSLSVEKHKLNMFVLYYRSQLIIDDLKNRREYVCCLFENMRLFYVK